MIDLLLTPWIWNLIGLVAVLVSWWLGRRMRWASLRLLLPAIVGALFFTPFIPRPTVEWSTPWPPAVFWWVVALFHGQLAPIETISIGLVALLLWGVGRFIERHWK